MISIKEINRMRDFEFIIEIGSIFEHSPWIAEKTWEFSPFRSTEEMYNAMMNVVEGASLSEKLSLLKAHPDLGTKLEISTTSKEEQLQAGLHQLSEVEYEEFSQLNKHYTEKFGFPFIMAVRGQDKQTIKENMKRRVNDLYEEEVERALQEVYKIARFRLADLVNEGSKYR